MTANIFIMNMNITAMMLDEETLYLGTPGLDCRTLISV